MAKQTERTREGGTHHVTPKKPRRQGSDEATQEQRDADETSDHRGGG